MVMTEEEKIALMKETGASFGRLLKLKQVEGLLNLSHGKTIEFLRANNTPYVKVLRKKMYKLKDIEHLIDCLTQCDNVIDAVAKSFTPYFTKPRKRAYPKRLFQSPIVGAT